MPQSLPSLQVSLLNDTGVSATDRLTQDSRLKFTGLVEGGTVQYSTNGQVWTATAPDAKQGLNTVYVRQIDAVGDYSAHSIIQYTFDNIAPTASLVINLRNDTGVSGDLVTREGALVVTNVGSGNRVEYSNNNLTWTTSQPTVVEGMNTVYIRQVDNAGNGSPVQTYDFVFDSKAIPPIVALIHDTGSSASDRVTNDARLSVTGTESGATIQYSKDGVTWGTTAPTATEGLNVVYVRQLDVTGNTSSANKFSFYFDSSAPQALSVSLLNDDGISNTDSITTDARLRLTGTESGAKVQYSANGQDWQDSAPVAVEGANTVYVRQTDVAGNISPVASINFTLGAVTPPPPPPPVIPPADLVIGLVRDTGVAGDLLTRDGSIAVSNVGQGNRLEYSSNGTDWSVNKPALVEGSNTVYVRQVNSAGNASTGQSMSFVLDRTVSAPIVSLLEDTGSSASDRRTSKGQLVVSGVEADATVQYSVNGTTWSTTQPVAVEGLNRVLVRQVDKAGNTSQHVVFQFTLDTTAPDVALNLSLRNDTGVDGDLISRSGAVLVRGATAGNRIEYSADGMDWSIKQPTAQEGANTVWVRLVDVAGNASSGQKLDFIIDTKAAVPEAKLLNDSGVLATDLLTNDDRLLVSGLELGAKAQYSTNNKDWSDTPAVSREGLNIVYVRQMDIAGNISSVKKLSYVYDSQISALQLALVEDTGLSSSDQITRRPMVSVSGLESGASWQYQVDGAGSWITGTGSSFNLVSGSHRYVVRHTDKAGNVVESSLTATLDTTVDAVQVVLTEDTGISATDGISQVTELTVSNIEDGALVEYSTDGTTWSRTAPTAQEGSNTVWVRQTDKAGNVSAAQQLQFVKDTQIQTPSLSFTDTGASDSDGITREPTVTVNGLEAGASWQYQVDGGVWQDGVGNSFNLVDGVHSYIVRQTDKAGNVATSAVLNVEFVENPDIISSMIIDSTGQAIDGGFTSDTNAVLRLTGEATDQWQYRYYNDPNKEIYSFSGSSDVVLGEGTHNVQIQRIDIAGHVVSTSARVIVDNSAATPTMTLIEDTETLADGITTNPLVKIGDVEKMAVWEVKVDDSPYWNTWPVSPDTPNQFKLLVGTHTYYIRQTDKSGNVSEIGEYTFTYQSAVPEPTFILDDTGANAYDLVTNNQVVQIGNLLPDAIWQYQIDNGEWITGTGTSFTMLADGQGHDYAIRQQSGGKWSEPQTLLQVRVDNSTPNNSFSIDLASDSGISSSDGITNQSTVVFNNLETGARLEYRIDGGSWQGVEISNSSMSLFVLDVGTHDYDFRQTDAAGNSSGLISRSYTYINTDVAAPSLSIANDTGQTSADALTKDSTINVALSVVGEGVYWQYEIDGNGTWLDGVGSSFNAQAGLHSYKVRQLDAAGNISPASEPLTVQLDTTAPTFSTGLSARVTDADSERSQLISTNQVLYTASASDANGVSLSMVENDIFTFNEQTGALSFKNAVGYQLNASNAYSAVLVATDNAGNQTQQTVTIHVDRTNTATPEINLNEIKKGSVTLNGTFKLSKVLADGSMLAMTDNGVGLSKVFNRYLADGSLDQSFNSIQIAGTNAKGNVDIQDFELDSQGGIYIFTIGAATSAFEYVARKFNSNGLANSTWGTNGAITTTIATGVTDRNEGTILSDGSVLVARASVSTGSTPNATMFIKFNANGQVTTNELRLTPLTANTTQDSSWKVIAGSNAQSAYVAVTRNSGDNLTIAKYNVTNNTLDTSFGTSGKLTLINSAITPDYMELDSQGRLLVSYFNSSDSKLYIHRLLSDGTADSTFGTSGVFSVASTNSSVVNRAIDLDTDNSMYVLAANKLMHVLANGTLDPNFGTAGQVTIADIQNTGAYAINRVGNSIEIVAPSLDALNNNQVSQIIGKYSLTGQPVTTFGDVALTLTEGNRPIGLLTTQATIIDADAANSHYNGVSISIERQGGANSTDVFSSRGKLSFSYGKIVWDGLEVGSVTNENGRLELTFNSAATHTIVDGVARAITYTNSSQQPTAKVKLLWTINDHDVTGERSASAVQTINMLNDNRDAGDPQIIQTNNSTTLTFNNFINVNGKYYYMAEVANHNILDSFFNNNQDTTISARSYTQANGMVFKLLSATEITALITNPTVTANSTWLTQLFQSSGSKRGVWAADLGTAANQHLALTTVNGTFQNTTDTSPFSGPRFGLIEVSPATIQDDINLQPQVQLAKDDGYSATDFITTNGLLNIIGLEGSVAFRYSTNAGQTWVNQAAGSPLTINLAQGTYLQGSIIVEQTDLSGFVSQIVNNNAYKIDASPEALNLYNDQGLSKTDLISADGRVVLSEFDTSRPYEYSVNGGATWQTGGMLNGTDYGFNLATGSYAVGQVLARQTDANNFTAYAKNVVAYTISPTVAQGVISLTVDNGASSSDRISSEANFTVTGLDASLAWQYSVNGGATWQTGTSSFGKNSFDAPEGSYAAGQIRVRQTDSKGFELSLQTDNTYRIDKTVKSLALFNDQGLNSKDFVTADGRVVVTGFDTTRPYEYSINGGSQWQTGGMLNATTYGFNLANGSYSTNQIQVRQTDANNFVTTVANDVTYTISPTQQQGVIALALDDGYSATDRVTSKGTFTVTGLATGASWEFSTNGGSTWTTRTDVEAQNSFEVAEGSYAVGQIRVRQTDSKGFSINLQSSQGYRIDKTPKNIALFNDQGLSNTDSVTADGRVVVTGLDTSRTYEYTLNGGTTWQTGGTLSANTYGFSLANGTYGKDQVGIRQTDANGFITYAYNTADYTISSTLKQGAISLNADTGTSFSDGLTNDAKFNVTGLDPTQPWQYSLNSGSTWLTGTTVGGRAAFDVPEGSYAAGQIRVQQTDSKGFAINFQTSAATQVDKTIATASISLVNDSGFSNTDLLTADGRVMMSITGSLNTGDTWQYSLDAGKTWTQGTGTSQTITLANGSYNAQQIRVQVFDQAGNSSTASFDKRVVVDNTDTTAPVFTNLSSRAFTDQDGTASGQKIAAGTVAMTLQTTDANTVYYSLSGAAANLFNLNQATGQISFKNDMNLISSSGDNYALTVTAKDAFNNTSTQNITIRITDGFKLIDKSVSNKDVVIDAAQDLILTFNQNVALNPSGRVIMYEPFAGGRILDINDPDQIKVIGNQVIIQTDRLSLQGAHRVVVAFGGITSADTGEKWSNTWADALGFTLSKELNYANGVLSPKDSFKVTSIDGTNGGNGTVAVLGDVNGDGISDWAVSYADGDSLGRTDNGKVYVVYGRTDGVVPNLSNIANGQGGYLISGRASNDLAGTNVSAAGDVNGDGLQDILIHAKGANNNLGKGYVVYGRSSASNLDLATLESNTVLGRVYNNNVLTSIDAIGDVNGDGFDDIAHSRHDFTYTKTWQEVKKTVSTYQVKSSFTIIDPSQPAEDKKGSFFDFDEDSMFDAGEKIGGFISDPWEAGIELGIESLADNFPPPGSDTGGGGGSGGGVNTNSFQYQMSKQVEHIVNQVKSLSGQELIGYSHTSEKVGGTTTYYLTFNIQRTDTQTIDNTLTHTAGGVVDIELSNNAGTRTIIGDPYQLLGIQTAALGDINGDGYADYAMLGDSKAANIKTRIDVMLGTSKLNAKTDQILTKDIDASPQQGFKIVDSTRSSEYVGVGNVTGLGDINGDGFSDFALTFDSVYAATYVVYGKNLMNSVDIAQIAIGNGGFVLRGESRRSNARVDAIGDFNGDGLDDFAYYESNNSNGFSDRLSIVYGFRGSFNPDDRGLLFGSKGFTVETVYGGSEQFAQVDTVSTGDVNGDGLNDMLIRAKNGDTLLLMGSGKSGKYSQSFVDQIGTTGNDTLTSTGKELIVAGLGNDTITANGADVILAGAGNDRVIINSTTLTALQSTMGNGGNTDQLARVDGGAGFDVLEVRGNISLDFSRISNKAIDQNGIRERIDGFEKIDLATDSSANNIKLLLADVLDIADSNVINTTNGWSNVTGSSLSSLVAKHQLVIAGTNADTATITGSEWTNTGTTVRDSSGEIYNVYDAKDAAAQLLIDKDMIVSVL
ncbi:Ig-like domain-containing protein [Agitococcus lubricus]|uniref:FG-GAP repeat protein n=1 Tax=Agitococcus lubricus TaxID=1077255 RepID=A0A2T5J4A1_9GAMM|nr:FG-GAP repeat protein [Agitococcus lubricus]PTQ91333.1 FG-GAP repeat protein [Agitococcus lubricus]